MLIYLTGFMGAGKTTAGKKLATLLGYNFIDLDELIEIETGKNMSQLFESGLPYFREVESLTLKSTSKYTDTVIATGGGSPCFHGNMEWMNQHGVTVYIRMTVGSLFHRLAASKQKRPLIAGKSDVDLMEFILTTLKERLVFYKQAKYIIKGESLDAKELMSLLKEGESQLR
ncbi:MAG: shikimate kinase [Bacteroidetes bacterium]|nr:shikimate kinase [Bacteroidota bacterium]